MTETILSILGGLALFLYAVNQLSESIKALFGEKSKRWVLRFTGNLFSSILTGAVVTTLLDSSSAVIILTIVLVNSKLLNLRQAMGIVLGANIGTTISSQIIAMDVGKYSPVFLILGLVLIISSKSTVLNNSGKAILYFGILFFGLYTMERSVEPLKQHPIFFKFMQGMSNPLNGTLAGALITLVIQSSSATVGMSIVLLKKGIMDITAGIAIMMGAELGTVSDTLLATIKGSRMAIKTGLFHLIFNSLSILVGLILFYPFINLVLYISGNSSPERVLANAHLLFNLLGVFCFIWTVPILERLLNKWLPEKNEF